MTLRDHPEVLQQLIYYAGVVDVRLGVVAPQIVGMFSLEERARRKHAAELLRLHVGGACDDLMAGADILLVQLDNPLRYDDLIRGRVTPDAAAPARGAADDGLLGEFVDGIGRLSLVVGRLVGLLHAATRVRDRVNTEPLLDMILRAVDDVLLAYDELQDVVGVDAPRHRGYLEHIGEVERG